MAWIAPYACPRSALPCGTPWQCVCLAVDQIRNGQTQASLVAVSTARACVLQDGACTRHSRGAAQRCRCGLAPSSPASMAKAAREGVRSVSTCFMCDCTFYVATIRLQPMLCTTRLQRTLCMRAADAGTFWLKRCRHGQLGGGPQRSRLRPGSRPGAASLTVLELAMTDAAEDGQPLNTALQRAVPAAQALNLVDADVCPSA